MSAIGIDEIAWKRGQKYVTLVYQIDVGRKRTQKTLREFFEWFGEKHSAEIRFVCSDMWKPYLRVIAQEAGQALHVLTGSTS